MPSLTSSTNYTLFVIITHTCPKYTYLSCIQGALDKLSQIIITVVISNLLLEVVQENQHLLEHRERPIVHSKIAVVFHTHSMLNIHVITVIKQFIQPTAWFYF